MIDDPDAALTVDSPLKNILQAYARTPSDLRNAMAGMNDDVAAMPPAAGEWSIAQVVMHLGLTNEYAMQTFLGTEAPTGNVMEPAPALPLAAAVETFAVERARLVEALWALPGDMWDQLWTFRGTERTARELVAGFVRHEREHIAQIQAARGQAGMMPPSA